MKNALTRFLPGVGDRLAFISSLLLTSFMAAVPATGKTLRAATAQAFQTSFLKRRHLTGEHAGSNALECFPLVQLCFVFSRRGVVSSLRAQRDARKNSLFQKG